jgi:serine phosphatase RsbU (regulator of sigma subunit)
VLARLLADAEPQIARLEGFFARQVALGRGTPEQVARARAAVPQGARDFAAFRATAARMVADTDAFVEDARDRQQRLTDILTIALLVLGVLVAVVAVRLSVVVRRRVSGLLEDLEAERAVSAAAAVRAEALQRVTAALAPALDEGSVLEALVGETSRAAGIDEVVLARRGPGGQHLERRSVGGQSADLDRRIAIDDEVPLAAVARSGEAAFLTGAGPLGPDWGTGSWAVLPVRGDPAGTGALALRFDEGRGFGAAERTFLRTLADQTGQALERVRLHQEQQEIAHVLQQSLLPRDLPEVADLRMAARYVTALSGQEVGGDFYDVFEVGDGRLVVMVGDACGKGPEAVALTALARYTVRAVADADPSPADALGRLNAAIRRQGFGTLYLTAALLSFARRDDGMRVTACRAGHPHPLVVRASGAVEEVGGPGTVLGVFDDPPLVDAGTELGPGDTVLVFTDGLTEARQGTAVLGDERLRAAASACAGMDVEACASHLLGTASAFAAGDLRDDVAVVVVRYRPDG